MIELNFLEAEQKHKQKQTGIQAINNKKNDSINI